MSRRSYRYPTAYGTGTESDPFLIYDSADLMIVESLLNPDSGGNYHTGTYHDNPTTERFTGQYLKLANDIDLSDICSSTLGSFQSGYSFAGDFNGDGHSIKNMYIYYTGTTSPSTSNFTNRCGLFYTLTDGARVHHLILEDFYIRAYSSALIHGIWGAAKVDHITMKNGTHNVNYRYAGVVGQLNNTNAVIENCISEGCTMITSNGQSYTVAGFITGAPVKGTVRYNINLSDAGSVNHYHIGGIYGGHIGFGANVTASITNNINFGKIRSSDTLSGCIAGNAEGTAKLLYNMNCGWLNSIRECSGILGYKGGQTPEVSGCLNIGVINPYGGTSQVNPIAVYGSPTLNYNYHNQVVSDVSASTANKVIPISQSDLVCTADNTKPSSITDSTYWNTNNWVFKKGYYPYPKGIDNVDACLCAGAPIIFSGSNTYKTITGTVQLGTPESYSDGITWRSSDESKMIIGVTGDFGTGQLYYIGTPRATGTVTLTNWKNGKSYKRITLTITSV